MELKDKLQRCIDLLKSIEAEDEKDGQALLETAIHRSMPAIQEWRKLGHSRIQEHDRIIGGALMSLPDQSPGRTWHRWQVRSAWLQFCSELHYFYPNEFPVVPGCLESSECRGSKPLRLKDFKGRPIGKIIVPSFSKQKEATWIQKRNDYITVIAWMINRANTEEQNEPEDSFDTHSEERRIRLYEQLKIKNRMAWPMASEHGAASTTVKREAKALGLQISDYSSGKIDLPTIADQLKIPQEKR